MKKSKIITRHVRETLFDADIVLIVCEFPYFLEHALKMVDKDKQESLKRMVERHGDDPWSKATQYPFGGGGSVIWAKPSEGLPTLVHEITHAAHHLLKCRDIKLTDETEEVYAYLVQFLFEGLVRNTK